MSSASNLESSGRRILISMKSKDDDVNHGNAKNIHNINNNKHDDNDSGEEEFDMPLDSKPPLISTVTKEKKSSSQESASVSSLSCEGSPNNAIANGSTNSNLWNALRNRNLDFAINTECTSLCVSASGNFLWAGFSDGTLRVFDLSGRFPMENDGLQASRQKSALMVASKFHQRFGAVACQIHARGVHTDLLMQIDTCGDYVFGGVPRGAMEVYAVSTKALEAAEANPSKNILDYLHVHVHADAKLKGFGACHQLQNVKRPTYLLLTGRGIKNIHIWKFQPPLVDSPESNEPAIWEQLYDTQTNGNTINFLSFYRNPQGTLLGISQSDTQKIRLWDLSLEEGADHSNEKERPKRPPYQDVTNSQSALGIAGGYGVCGGPTMYNQLSIVSLDQPKSAYNHTELALPGANATSSALSMGRGRQRRGDLKQLVRVATLPQDSNHALLELDDGSIVHYTAADFKEGRPNLTIVSKETTGIPPLPADYWCRTMCLGNPSGVVVAAVSMYNPNTQMGQVVVRALQAVPPASPAAADARALSNICMQAPPSSLSKKTKKKKKKKKKLNKRLEMNPTESGLTEKHALKALKKKRKLLKKQAEQKLQATTPISATKEVTMNIVPASIKKAEKENRVPKSVERSNGVIVVPKSSAKTKRQSSTSSVEDQRKRKASRMAETPLNVHQVPPTPMDMTPISKFNISHVKNKPHTEEGDVLKTVPAQGLPTGYVEVSPSSATPLVGKSSTIAETPSSAESKAGHAPISDFLKPKRVLHPWSEQKGKEQPGTEMSVPSPAVPRKQRKTQVPNESTETNLDDSRVEVKVRKTLKIKMAKKESRLPNAKVSTNESEPASENKRKGTPKPTSIAEEANIKSSSKRRKSNPTVASVENAATLLVDLKSPAHKKDTAATASVGSLSRRGQILEKATAEYRNLQAHIAALPTRPSPLLSQRPGSFRSVDPVQSMRTNHIAALEMLQKRLLRSAEFVLQSVLSESISVEDARLELKESLRSYEEVLHDTIRRQQMEVDSLPHNANRQLKLSFPFRESFQKVEAIYKAIEPPKRPPGRPKNSSLSS